MPMHTTMSEPLTVSALAGSVWRDFLRARRALFIYEFLFKLLEAWLFIPAVALVLATILAAAGHVAVSNRDILDFLLTPAGLLYAALFGSLAAALLLVEQGGIMVLTALNGSVERPPIKETLRAAFGQTWHIAQLGGIVVGLLALALLPFVLLAYLTYRILLQHDINFYLEERPPLFWLAVSIGVLLLSAALAIGTWLYVRWAFALPILLFERRRARAALRTSRERVRGVGWRVGMISLGWLLGALLIGVALEAGFQFIASVILDNAGERPVVVSLLLLAAQGGLLATWSFFIIVGLGLITRRLYLQRTEQLGLLRPVGLEPASGAEKPPARWNWGLALISLPLFLLVPLALWTNMSRYLAARPKVQVTAHRGHSMAAPENTLSAVRKAIESGADYAEVDVLLTADGVVVLLHDRDLKRVAGDPRRIEDVPYDEVRKLDVGGWFDPSFAGERVPTLAEVIDMARGRIKLNIELKFYGPDRRLAEEVARLVREKDFESDCIITSFNSEALQDVKQHNPRLRIGLIIGHALGDVSRLEVDLLSVRADFLSDEVLRAARRQDKEVHVWTVNDARQMGRLIMRGVDNIITDDPDLAIRVRDEWERLTGSERLVLASRLLLGLNP
jgi:glycerophosphoryl diester phosphodiesterase